MSDGSQPYEPKDWRELLVAGRNVHDDFQFGQVLGIGSYGLIREAVYIPEARAFQRKHSLEETDSPLPNFLHTSNGTVLSIFEGGELESFAVKTLDKSQENVLDVIVPNEVLSLIRIQQARNLEDDEMELTKKKIEDSVRLYAVYEEADSVHLVLENC